jgi:hemerythrin-like domain-containing protein
LRINAIILRKSGSISCYGRERDTERRRTHRHDADGEHEEGRGHVRSMLAAMALVEAKDEAAKEILIDKASAYLRLLKEHIQKEDEILFKIADDVISPDEQKQLLRSFEEHEAKEIGEGVHEKYLKIAEELEAKTG